ncbi:MAG TPA: hypothetical protein VFZ87_07115 [Gemmatimonadales bacterium]
MAREAAPVAAAQTILLTEDVASRLISGLKAGQAERQRAEPEDTPYGQYQRAQTAYAAAKSKCQAAQQRVRNPARRSGGADRAQQALTDAHGLARLALPAR